LIGRRGGGAESPAAAGSPEFTVFSVPGLNSARVLIGEQELDTANASRVSGKWDRGRVGARGSEAERRRRRAIPLETKGKGEGKTAGSDAHHDA